MKARSKDKAKLVLDAEGNQVTESVPVLDE